MPNYMNILKLNGNEYIVKDEDAQTLAGNAQADASQALLDASSAQSTANSALNKATYPAYVIAYTLAAADWLFNMQQKSWLASYPSGLTIVTPDYYEAGELPDYETLYRNAGIQAHINTQFSPNTIIFTCDVTPTDDIKVLVFIIGGKDASNVTKKAVVNPYYTPNVANITSLLNALVIVSSATGNPATFTDGAAFEDRGITVQIVPIQDGSGTPSPSNPRALHPVFDIVVTVNGVSHYWTLGQNVYGGSVNYGTGEVTKTHAMVTMGSLTWNVDSNRPGVFYSSSLYTTLKAFGTCYCEQYDQNNTGPSYLSNYEFSTTNDYGSGYVFFKNPDFIGYTGAQVAEALGTCKLVYETVTSSTGTTSIRHTMVAAGSNSVSSDSGNVTINYVADTKTYVDNH